MSISRISSHRSAYDCQAKFCSKLVAVTAIAAIGVGFYLSICDTNHHSWCILKDNTSVLRNCQNMRDLAEMVFYYVR